MSEDDIDFDRVIADPKYRRRVIDYLNGKDGQGVPDNAAMSEQEPDDGTTGAETHPGILQR